MSHNMKFPEQEEYTVGWGWVRKGQEIRMEAKAKPDLNCQNQTCWGCPEGSLGHCAKQDGESFNINSQFSYVALTISGYICALI